MRDELKQVLLAFFHEPTRERLFVIDSYSEELAKYLVTLEGDAVPDGQVADAFALCMFGALDNDKETEVLCEFMQRHCGNDWLNRFVPSDHQVETVINKTVSLGINCRTSELLKNDRQQQE